MLVSLNVWGYCTVAEGKNPDAIPHESNGMDVPGALHGMYLFHSPLGEVLSTFQVRSLALINVGVPGLGQLRLAGEGYVSFPPPEHVHPIKHPTWYQYIGSG